MRSFLFIVTESLSANGICTAAVIDELVKMGHRVSVLTQRERGMEREFLRGGVLYRTVAPRLSYRLAKRGQRGGAIGRLSALLSRLISRAESLLSYPTWPLVSLPLASRYKRAARRMARKEKFHTVVPVYTQIDALIAAAALKRSCPEVKLVPYLLDGFSAGHSPKHLSREWAVKRCLKWEKKLFSKADRIIMMESARAHYDALGEKGIFPDYLGRTVFLDLPLYSPREGAVPGGRGIAYFGSLPLAVRDPRPFLDLFMKSEGDMTLTLVGTGADELLSDYVRRDPRIRVLPAVSHEEAIRMMGEADFLLNFGNSLTYMTPCKIFEYASFGKPIISTMPIDNEPGAGYLKDYPLALLLRDSDPAEERLARLSLFLSENKGRRVDLSELRELYPNCRPRVTAQEILSASK